MSNSPRETNYRAQAEALVARWAKDPLRPLVEYIADALTRCAAEAAERAVAVLQGVVTDLIHRIEDGLHPIRPGPTMTHVLNDARQVLTDTAAAAAAYEARVLDKENEACAKIIDEERRFFAPEPEIGTSAYRLVQELRSLAERIRARRARRDGES